MRSVALAILSARRLPLWLAVLAVLLAAPALGTGLVVDDFVLRAVETGHPVTPQGTPLDVFRFVDAANLPGLMDGGILPWWTSPELKLAFFRPLAAASHWLDFQLFPGSAVAMHVVSLAWLAATVWVASVLYRRLLGTRDAESPHPPWIAGLSALMFAVDPGHALTAGWISARNAVMAAFFGLLTLYLHDRARRDGTRWAAFVAPLACAASLACGESGLATLALVGAYALTLDGPPAVPEPSGWARRARSLAPFAAVALAWAAVYRWRGCGAAHSAMYADPLSSPAEFLRAATLGFPQNLGARFGGPPAALALLSSARLGPVLAAAGLVFTLFAAAALGPALRREPVVRFFAVAAVLAGVPIAGTVPNDRNLFFLGFVSFGLTALILGRAAEVRSVPLRIYAGWLLFLVALAVPLSPANSVSMNVFAKLSRDPLSKVLLDDAVRGQTVVFVNPPTHFFVSHLAAMRAGTDVPAPARVRSLYPGIYQAELVRPRADQLAIHVEGGMLPHPGTWPASPGEARAVRWDYTGQTLTSFVRSPDEPLHAGDVTLLAGCRVEVTAVDPRGGPTDVTFTFDRPLDDPSLRFVAWRDGKYAPFPLPRVGERISLPPAPMAREPRRERPSA
jgi:hypothetical protein